MRRAATEEAWSPVARRKRGRAADRRGGRQPGRGFLPGEHRITYPTVARMPLCRKGIPARRHQVVTPRGVRMIPTDGHNGGGPGDDRGSVTGATCAERKPKRTYSKHGLVRLRAAVRELGPRVVDRRTTLGKQLAAW